METSITPSSHQCPQPSHQLTNSRPLGLSLLLDCHESQMTGRRESLELDGPSVYDEKKALDEPGFAV